MKDLMVRFLNSIHIENIDDFDLDFDMVGKNRFNKNQIDMIIVKDTPWIYPLLRKFQDGLDTINYPYSLHFSYRVKPDFKDVSTLFENWYQTLYRLPPNITLTSEKKDIFILNMKMI